MGRARTLIIKAVEAHDGKWSVMAEFGVTGQSLMPLDATLEVRGGDLTLQFRTAPSSSQVKENLYRLTLYGGKDLLGSVVVRFVQTDKEFSMRLEKVE